MKGIMIYKIIKQAISQELAEFVYSYFLNKRKVARLFFDEFCKEAQVTSTLL